MKNRGFTMVELLITMVIFVFVIAGASRIFIGLLSQFKQQGGISQTNIQGQSGLEMMRRDIEQAGYGLPKSLKENNTLASYNESAMIGDTGWVDRNFSDGPTSNPSRGDCAGVSTCLAASINPDCDLASDSTGACSNPPAPFRSGEVGIANSDSGGTQVQYSQADVLVIKSAVVAMTPESQKWTYISNAGGAINRLNEWNTTTDSANNPAPTDQIIVLDPNTGALQFNTGNGNFWDSLNDDTFSFKTNDPTGTPNSFEPATNSFAQYVVYDIAPADPNGSHIRMPFNRADYYIKIPPTGMPSTRCAPNTGILYKAVTINTMNSDGSCNSTGGGGGGCVNRYPIMDCVADMQVVYLMGPAGSNTIDWCLNDGDCTESSGFSTCPNAPPSDGRTSNTVPTVSPTQNIECLTASEIRSHLKQVRVYIVAQEGRRDPNYDFSENGTRAPLSAVVHNPNDPSDSSDTYSVGLVDLSKLVGADYIHYRWKIYTIVVDPKDMN